MAPIMIKINCFEHKHTMIYERSIYKTLRSTFLYLNTLFLVPLWLCGFLAARQKPRADAEAEAKAQVRGIQNV